MILSSQKEVNDLILSPIVEQKMNPSDIRGFLIWEKNVSYDLAKEFSESIEFEIGTSKREIWKTFFNSRFRCDSRFYA